MCSDLLSRNSINEIVNEIKELEKERDPKCYATASRLEDFMFGTPLTDEARFKKNLLNKSWVKMIWQNAGESANNAKQQSITQKHIKQAIEPFFEIARTENNHWLISFKNGQQLKINKDDKRQYSSIAYSLRAVLGVQQESLMDLDSALVPLSASAIEELKHQLDLLSLAVLKISDAQARKNDQHQINESSLVEVWNNFTRQLIKPSAPSLVAADSRQAADLSLVKKVIQQKVESYKAYNQISNQLFVRNLQVYFARLRWPKDQQEGNAFRGLFTETLIQFAHDLYKESEKIALENGHHMILESDIHELVQIFIPHEINEYEDAIFFPNLATSEQVNIESYDMDSFRDSGVHWRYLEFAINSPNFNAVLQPDPFAMELLVENIAQFGVLSLRMAGNVGKQNNDSRLKRQHFIDGLKIIQSRVNKHISVNNKPKLANEIVSSHKQVDEKSGIKFSDVSGEVNIDFMHRSSDWLNRMLRSYLDKEKGLGIITIPPAFGGSGVAAEDINNDGFVDFLILSGVGNKLYLNENGQSFKDVTEESGLQWLRSSDNTHGEPRQPIIADLNNDGLQDIVITYVNDKHRVYQNLGNAKFKDVTDVASLGGDGLVGGPATVADFDNDGLLDIYVTYFGNYIKGVLPTLKRRNDNGLPNQLFKNLGDFKFKNITSGSGTDHTGWAQAVAHTDFDGDNRQDLIVGNDFGVNAYLKNLGNGKFKNIAAELGTDKPSYTMNIGIADLNQDLKPDIYISNIVTMNKDEKYVLPNEDTPMKFNVDKLAQMRVVEANDLFLSQTNNEQLSYHLSDAVGRGYSSTGWSWDADFFDYDNDGDNDLYVLNGMNEFNLYSNENPYYTDPHSEEQKNIHIPDATEEPNVFFENSGGKLVNDSKNSGLDLVSNSRSAAYFDYDEDGDLDIVLNNYHQQAFIYRNNLKSNKRNWIKIKLIGDTSKRVNRDAIGARIIVKTNSGNKIWREIHSTIGYMSGHPKQQHMGLGGDSIEELIVEWPNGEVTSYGRFDVNQSYLIYQAKGNVVSLR